MTAAVQSLANRSRRRIFHVARMAVLVAVLLPLFATASGRTAGNPVLVTISFDDGNANQYQARPILASHNMHATFWINSGVIGASKKMTWPQVHDLANDGNEIAGHTALHPNLTTLDPSEQAREICDDRTNLINQGFQPTDFAYPFGAWTDALTTIVQNCGYDTGRTNEGFPGDTVDEQVPPASLYHLHTPPDIKGPTSLSDAEGFVTAAEQANNGGWIELRFHNLCDGCDLNSTTLPDFTSLLDWLQGQVTAGNVVIETAHQVFGGAFQPAVPGPPPPPAPGTVSNGSLESDSDGDGTPDCYEQDDYGTNTPTFTRTTDAHSGTYAQSLQVTNWTSGAAQMLITNDLGECSPSVAPNTSYLLSVWYKSTAPVHLPVYYRNGTSYWSLWKTSAAFPASATWTQASFITGPTPADATALSFGLDMESNGSVTTDDYSLAPTETTPPQVSVTGPSDGSTVNGTVAITADASDNVAVDHVDFLDNGVLIGTDSTSPYSINWDTTQARNGVHAITARAVDTSLNSTVSSPVNVTVNNAGGSGVQNASLETDADGDGVPDCFQAAGTDSAASGTYTRVTDAHSGTYAEQVTYSPVRANSDQKLLIALNTNCAVPVTAGTAYQVSAWYKSTAPVRLDVFTGTSTGTFSGPSAWRSPLLPASSTWTQAVWVTPAVPTGSSYISFGLALESGGSVTSDDYNLAVANAGLPTMSLIGPASGATVSGTSVPMTVANLKTNNATTTVDHVIYYVDNIPVGVATSSPWSITWNSRTVPNGAHAWVAQLVDSAGNWSKKGTVAFNTSNDLTPPTVSLTAPADQSTVSGTSVTLAASAADEAGGSGVGRVDFAVDGVVVGTATTAPYQVSWNSRNVSSGPHQVTAVAYDVAGNSATSTPSNITTANDFTAPVVSLDTTPSNPSNDQTPTFAFSADKPSTFACSLDGTQFTPCSSPDSIGPLAGGPHSFVVQATDTVGNVGTSGLYTWSIDTVPPSSTIACGGGACTGYFGPSSPITLSATDGSGSGVSVIRYTTDGSDPADSSTAYTGPFTLASTATVKFRAWDDAGNEESVESQLVQIDATAPSSTISCNGTQCGNGFYSGSVSVTLGATDAVSGVSAIRYTTDGSDPTSASSLYTGAFSVGSTTTVKFRAWDNAGNVEAVNTQVIQIDTLAPVTSISCNGSACAGYYNAPVSVTLSSSDGVGSGVAEIHYTTDGSDPTLSSPLYSGPFTVSSATTIKFRAWDGAGNEEQVESQGIQFDTVAPSSSISCNATTCSTGFYNAPVSVTLSATDDRSGVSAIRYTTDGSDPTASSRLYTGAFTVSSTTTVKFRSWDNAGNVEAVHSQLIQVDTAAPMTTISCNSAACTSGYYPSGVFVTLSSTDGAGSGVAMIRYTIDGSTPTTTSPLYTGTFVVASTATVKFRAWDNAGNVEAVHSQLIQIDGAAPTTTITCNNAACASTFYTAAVTARLSAADTGGSGIAATRYTTNGTDPTTTSTLYTGAFTVSSTTTVKFRSWDNAGNVEAVHTQLIQVDTAAPTTTISCNGTTCQTGYYNATVSATLSSTDPGGSGVSAIRYTTNGANPTTASPLYTSAISVSTTTTLKFRAWDNAGNVEAVHTQVIQVDTVAPTTTITCGGATCTTGYYTAAVTVRLNAADTGGSGLAATRYTTNGTDPTTSSTLYTGTFSLSSTTTVKFRSWDNAGNVEAVHTQLIQVDTAAPTTTISCNGAACKTGYYNAAVSVTLSPTDTGGSGLSATRYTTDGSNPTTTSHLYTGPFTVSATATVKFRSWDNAGNVEAVKSQTINIDTAKPTVSISSPANGARVTGSITINATAADTGGSNLASVAFYVDGALISTDTSSPWRATWNTSGYTKTTHTIYAIATDGAGNTTKSATITVTVT